MHIKKIHRIEGYEDESNNMLNVVYLQYKAILLYFATKMLYVLECVNIDHTFLK